VRIVSHVVDREIADWVRREALAAVVSRGTGKKAAISGYEIFGKTGTAQKLDPETGQYSRELHVSSFVCGAPVDDPRVLVMISVDQPTVSVAGEHFGGSVAAPAAGLLLHHCLVRLKVPANEKLIRAALLPDDFHEQFLE
jgi:cell division protein FtsI/penicillin-binding protein 2